VLVVFRGAITKADWSHVASSTFFKAENPIPEDFDGKPAKIDIHGGFYRYLFRVRQDTGTKKYVSEENISIMQNVFSPHDPCLVLQVSCASV